MSTTTEQLVVALEARIRDFERNMAKASGTASRQFGQIERQAQQSGRRMESAIRASTANVNRMVAGMGAGLNREFSNFGRTLTAALAGAASARGAQQLLDSSTRITNALKVAGLEGERLSSVYDTLFASAQRNSAPLESLVTLYGRVAIVQNELGVSGAELLSFTDNVALALRVAGTDAQSASGALLQLSQAMGAGTVRAEEFNSILEGALPIAQAAAAGMKEAGGSVAALRALVVDGKVSSEAFFRAFEAGSVILEEKVAGAESTVSQGFVRLQNVLIDVAGRMDEGTDASDRLVGVLTALTDWIETADFSIAINGILDMANAAITTIGHIQTLGAALGALTGADQFGDWWRDQRSGATMVRDVHAATQGSGSGDAASDAAIAAALASRGATTSAAPIQLEEVVVGANVTPVSIGDYPVGGTAGGGSGGRARGGGRGGEGGGRDREAAQAERQAEAVRDLITELEREQSLLSATDAQRAVSDALKRAGAAATDEQKARIEELVTAIEREKEAMEGLKAAQEEMRSVASDVLSGIATGLKDGASAGELMAGVIDKLVSKLIDMAVQNLVANAFGGASGGGLFGAIFGGVAKGFASGGHVRGPGTGTSDSIPAMLSDGEYVINAKSTRENRALLEAINSGRIPRLAAGGPVGGSSYVGATTRSNTFSPVINVSVAGSSGNRQADQEQAAQIANAVQGAVRAEIANMMQDEMRPQGTLARKRFSV